MYMYCYPEMHSHTHACTQTHAHAQAYAHTHIHSHTQPSHKQTHTLTHRFAGRLLGRVVCLVGPRVSRSTFMGRLLLPSVASVRPASSSTYSTASSVNDEGDDRDITAGRLVKRKRMLSEKQLAHRFVDFKQIGVTAGSGGDGCMSFLRYILRNPVPLFVCLSTLLVMFMMHYFYTLFRYYR